MIKTSSLRRCSLAAGAMAVAAVGLTAGAHAAVITPVSLTTDPTIENGYSGPDQIINGSGLSATPTEANIDSVLHTTNGYGGASFDTGNKGVGNVNDVDLFVTFDLTSDGDPNFNLTNLYIWNGSQPGNFNKGLQNFNLSTSSDGTTFNSAGSFTLQQATGNPTGVQTFSLSGLTAQNVQFVRLEVVDTYGNADASIGEVRFSGDAVPEPSTYITLLGGLGALLFFRRRSA